MIRFTDISKVGFIIIFQDKFVQWIKEKKLLKLTTNDSQSKIVRMLDYQAEEKMVMAYDVDNKLVYKVKLTEIYQIKSYED